jgi:hypothetical protein
MRKQTVVKRTFQREPMRDPLGPGFQEDDYDFPERERRRFRTEKEYEAYLRALPTVEIQFDPRLKPVRTSVQLSQRTIDGYNDLAKQHGLRSGQTLMQMVLDAYLESHVPEDF